MVILWTHLKHRTREFESGVVGSKQWIRNIIINFIYSNYPGYGQIYRWTISTNTTKDDANARIRMMFENLRRSLNFLFLKWYLACASFVHAPRRSGARLKFARGLGKEDYQGPVVLSSFLIFALRHPLLAGGYWGRERVPKRRFYFRGCSVTVQRLRGD